MTRRKSDIVGGLSLSRTFYDIAHVLESAEDSEARVIHVLEKLRTIVPYERCAVLEVLHGGERRLIAAPGTPLAERAALMATTTALLGEVVDQHRHVSEATALAGTHLAVPLVGLDEVVGVLFVDRGGSAYSEAHVRRLSVVGAKIGAYFSMLRASIVEAERTREIEEARRAAEKANRAKDEFLALVSHELRTPLTTILAWAEALRSKETLEADRTRAFEGIERSVRREAKLIEDLLDLSSIANATLRLDLRAVEPAKVIKAAIWALSPRAELKSIRLEAVLDESVRPLIADPHRLSQIVSNLVANAIKFTPDGGSVEVRLERTGVLARIRVIDSGPGIKADLLPNLFERFRQEDSSSTRTQGGLGVGLALVKDLVELHGGHVRAESLGEQKGATFIVELPLAGATAEALARSEAGSALAGISVLLVDDDRDICEVLQFVLEGQGAVVTVATSAAEALGALERSMPNVLLSDIAMPGETGFDLMRKIVARAGPNALPAAGLTAYATGQGLKEALSSGFQMLLAKPIDPQTLIAAVASLAKTGDSARPRDEWRRL